MPIMNGCTPRTFYLSLQDHISKEATNVYDWEVSEMQSENKSRIDSLVYARENLHSFLIIKDDKLQYEWYAKGFSQNILCNLKSASKSIVSLLVGIAIENGKLQIDTDLKKIFGGSVRMDSLTEKVTIEQLLTMKGGFPYIGIGYLLIVCSSLNPTKSIIKKRIAVSANDSAVYSDISVNLLGYAISEAVNMKLEEYARRELFLPLGIHSDTWVKDMRGNNATAGDIFLCPRDLARIGFLMLHKGKIGDQRIISEQWIEKSTTSKTDIAQFPSDLRYGYLWWLDKNKDCSAFCAIGSGGQILYISPIDNAIVVMTSSLKSNNWHSGLQMIRDALKEVEPYQQNRAQQ
jgi:CubicO group peptidase (beta-lactamase class C family)